MSEVFSRHAELGVKLAMLALVLGTTFGIVLWMAKLRAVDATGVPSAQPIPFSHKHHVGDVGLDCRYCHSTVETSAFAGMPATDTCLTCHSQLFVDAPLLAPLHRSAATGQPIAWKRLHKLPDFVYFDHSIHIAKGVGCVECHGRVDQMPLEWRSAPLQMQWCLACHRDPRPHLRPRDAVFSMLPAPAASMPAVALQSTRRLTDCSTCHR
jgi:hypothetical protein